MIVYVVQRYVDYDGTDLLGIFDSNDKARKFAKLEAETYVIRHNSSLIENEQGFHIRDVHFEVFGCEVK